MEEMSRTEVHAPVLAAVDVEVIRQVHAPMLNLRLIANGKDVASRGDGSTIGFPARSKKSDTFSSTGFTELLQCVMTKMHGSMAALVEDKRFLVFRKKVTLLTEHPDPVDEIVVPGGCRAGEAGAGDGRLLCDSGSPRELLRSTQLRSTICI